MRKTKRSGAAMRVRPRGEHLAPAPGVKGLNLMNRSLMKIEDYELWLERLKDFGQKEVEIERFSATWKDLFNLARGLSVSRQRSVCLPSTPPWQRERGPNGRRPFDRGKGSVKQMSL